tara:strand:+ start:3534 stop:3839 length:306 start_codon:yes stop_codon:yes gene_type:complete
MFKPKNEKQAKSFNAAGKALGLAGGVADLIAINTTDDKVRETAQYTGIAMNGAGDFARKSRYNQDERYEEEIDDGFMDSYEEDEKARRKTASFPNLFPKKI